MTIVNDENEMDSRGKILENRSNRNDIDALKHNR